MLIISISTVSKECSIFIKYSEKEFFVKQENVDMIEYLPVEFEKIIKNNNIDLEYIDNFLISNGPGYYTGIRIGTAFAKGIMVNNTDKIIEINSLDILAYKSNFKKTIPLLKARKGIFHCAFFINNKRLSNDLLIKEKDIYAIKDYNFIGEGLRYLDLEKSDIEFPDAKSMYEMWVKK